MLSDKLADAEDNAARHQRENAHLKERLAALHELFVSMKQDGGTKVRNGGT